MRHLIAICAVALGGGALAAGGTQFSPSFPSRAEASTDGLSARAFAAARPGDVLFKDGGGFWGGLAARFSSNDDGYGHVGIVAAADDGGLVVIHAGGDPVSQDGRVQKTPFDSFIGASRAIGLYRPALDEAALSRALDYAERAAVRAAPFDAAFSLETEDALYCTELIWRALTAGAGEDAAPNKSMRAGKVYIALDDLQASPVLLPMLRLTASPRNVSAEAPSTDSRQPAPR